MPTRSERRRQKAERERRGREAAARSAAGASVPNPPPSAGGATTGTDGGGAGTDAVALAPLPAFRLPDLVVKYSPHLASAKTFFLLMPLVLAFFLSVPSVHRSPLFSSYFDLLPDHGVDRSAFFIVAIWVGAAVIMSFIFCVQYLPRTLTIGLATPPLEQAEFGDYSRWLKRAIFFSALLLFLFVALFVLALWPALTTQSYAVILSGIPLVGLITLTDHSLSRAHNYLCRCEFPASQERNAKAAAALLEPATRFLFYLDGPILLALLPVTLLKTYWILNPDANQTFAGGFAAGAIAMHLVLGNLIGIILEEIEIAPPRSLEGKPFPRFLQDNLSKRAIVLLLVGLGVVLAVLFSLRRHYVPAVEALPRVHRAPAAKPARPTPAPQATPPLPHSR